MESKLAMSRILLALILLAVGRIAAGAEPLVYDDFQDGDAEGWQAFGDGSRRLLFVGRGRF